MTQRMRLDVLLAARGLVESRARARDAILRGRVTVNGVTAEKPGQSVSGDAAIGVEDEGASYVSRGALKLVAGLDAFSIDVAGLTALDVGASTGGFTEVLLRREAAHVVAIDVGHGQLHPRIAADGRVTAIEGLNARALDASHLDGRRIDLVVADVSFISLKLSLPPALALAAPGAHGVFLVKPQFEAGREAIGKGGLLRDPAEGRRVADAMLDWLGAQPSWTGLGLVPSPIEGGDGNIEYLIAGRKTA